MIQTKPRQRDALRPRTPAGDVRDVVNSQDSGRASALARRPECTEVGRWGLITRAEATASPAPQEGSEISARLRYMKRTTTDGAGAGAVVAGKKGEESVKGMTKLQRPRIGRLQKMFRKTHPTFRTLAHAISHFTSQPSLELDLLRWELVSLAYTAEMCVRYERAAIQAGKRLVEANPGLLQRLGGDAEGKALVMLPARDEMDDEVGTWKWKVVSPGGSDEVVVDEEDEEDVEDASCERLSSSGSTVSTALGNIGGSFSLDSVSSDRARDVSVIDIDQEDASTSNLKPNTPKGATHPQGPPSVTIAAPKPSSLTPAPAPTSTLRIKPSRAAIPTMETRLLLLDTTRSSDDASLSLLLDHGPAFSDLWSAYRDPDNRASAEKLHAILEAATPPPRVAFRTGGAAGKG
ncbi:hypothetical protein HK101_002648, partial [Irineochytrium annulatum]